MAIDVVTAGVFAIVAAVIGAGAGYFLTQLSKNNSKIVEVSVIPTSLVDPGRLGPLSVSVDKGFITSQPSAENIKVPVKSAYNFTIDISNIGEDDLVTPDIDIMLDENAVMLPPEFKSDSIPIDKLKVVKDPNRPNYIRIIPQYINKQKRLSISVMSVNNKNEKCEVVISGVGIKQQAKVQEARLSTGVIVGLAITAGLVVGIIIGAFSLLFVITDPPISMETPTPFIVTSTLNTPYILPTSTPYMDVTPSTDTITSTP